MTTQEQRWQDLGLEAGRVFTPTTPIDERALFSGREEQVRLIVDVINQKGQHALIFGERGVGKTSLSNVLTSFLGNQAADVIAQRVNCDSTDTFSSIWQKVFEPITLTRRIPRLGFGATPGAEPMTADELLGGAPGTPESVRRALTILASQSLPIIIIDEFDRLPEAPRRALADLIKTLSDHAIAATLILVGVADSVEQLVQEHQSVERALVQIRMPRMMTAEITQIVTNGVQRLGMTVSDVARSRIARLSQGLPHYAHLLGLYAARSAVDQRQMSITVDSVKAAMTRAIQGAQQTIRSTYDYAVRSPRKDNLFGDVLLACAMAETNELGYFAAQDIREPMQSITGKRYEIPSFAQHLNEFCDEKRGPILYKDGTRRRYRYRFINPLLQPFVIMRGLDSGRIQADVLD